MEIPSWLRRGDSSGCLECDPHSSGKCAQCKGTGQSMTGLSCSICHGTGRCRSCDGTGVNNPALQDLIPDWIARFFGPRHRDRGKVEDEAMTSELFPPGFPSELRLAAFRAGAEVAWPPMPASAAVEWLSANGYAVLGTELWLLKDGAIQSLPVGLSGKREVHGNTVNRGNGESWNSFVVRAGAETRAYLQAFKLSDIVEPGQLVFNLVWVSEADFKNLSPRSS
jgi:hypothetical protein